MAIPVDGYGSHRPATGDRHDALAAERGRDSRCQTRTLAEPVSSGAGKQDRPLGRSAER